MFTIICGEDSVSSRGYLNQLKNDYRSKNCLTEEIAFEQIPELTKGNPSFLSLFNEKRAFFINNLDRQINRSSSLSKILSEVAGSKEIIFIDWEDGKSAWELKLKKIGIIKEFKIKENIFKLTDACYSGNKTVFINQLNLLSQNEDDQFIFIMLVRHLKNLILAKSDCLPVTMPFWQKNKINLQAKKWSLDQLIKYYQGLHNIDIMVKTGVNPTSLKKSIDILSCYYL